MLPFVAFLHLFALSLGTQSTARFIGLVSDRLHAWVTASGGVSQLSKPSTWG